MATDLRIAMLHWAFPPVVGGVETHLEELGAALARRGHTVHAMVGSKDEGEGERAHRGIAVWPSRAMQLGQSISPREVEQAVGDFLERARPDLLHAHNLHYFSEAHAEALRSIKRATGLPIVLTAHNVWRDQMGDLFVRYAPLWDRIIAVSHYLRRALVAQGYPAERIAVVHHGVDPRRWAHEPPGPDATLRIFHPARLSLDKGSRVLVQAFAEVRRRLPAAQLLLAGTGRIVDFGSRQAAEVAAVRREIAALGLEDAVELRAIPWEEIPEVFQSSRVVVYPSRFDEPFGIAALEGMASARPVVVTAVGGMPEFVRDGLDGFIIPPDDPQALGDRIALLLENPLLARRMGLCGRRWALCRFDLRQMVETVLGIYQATVSPLTVPLDV